MSNIKSITSDSNGMIVEWAINNVCNYRCSYCHPLLHNGSSGQPNLEESLKFFNSLSLINNHDKVLQLTGGEPTVWKDLIKFIQNLNKDFYVQITTNGSRTINWWKKLLSNCDNIHKISISVHLEFADTDHILKLTNLLSTSVDTTIQIMADSKNFDKVQNFANKLVEENTNATIHIKTVRSQYDFVSQDYTEEQKHFIKNFRYKKPFEHKNKIDVPAHLVINDKFTHNSIVSSLIANNEHKFKDWKCYMGKNRIFVWYDGTIYGASCHTSRKYPMGNIKTGLDKNFDYIICEDNFCPCLSDIRIPKHV